jgi:LCP family protein required for cell wall assembly
MSPQFGRRRLLDPAGDQATYDRAQRRTRIIGRIIVGFMAVVVMAGAGGVLVVKQMLDKVHHQPSLNTLIDPNSRPAKESPQPVAGAAAGGTAENILILGVDSREGENSAYQVTSGQLQTEDLSDTAILAHLSADGKHVTLVSIPRDSVVTIPSCEKVDSHGVGVKDSNGQPVMTKQVTALFNEAIELGGPACTVKTVENLTNVYIDHYLEIDFEGVVKMSTALGGVPLTMCEPIHDAHTGLNLPAGLVNLEGAQALAFVRARYGLTGGDDLHRIQRQQQFMASMARKALASSTLLNFPSMVTFYDDVASSLTTDMKSSDLINLALRYRKIDTSNIVFATVPTYSPPKGSEWAEHLFWSTDEANALFTAIRNDQPLTTTTSNGQNVAALTVAPSQISVRVLNGTTTNNLAHDVADQLAAKGFRIAGIDSAADVPTANTTLSYSASLTDSAQTLTAALAKAPQQSVSSSTAPASSTITLTIGQDWAGLASASASAADGGAAGSASPSAGSSSPATASPLPGVKTTTATTDTCVQG